MIGTGGERQFHRASLRELDGVFQKGAQDLADMAGGPDEPARCVPIDPAFHPEVLCCGDGGDGFCFLIDQVMQIEWHGVRFYRPGIEAGEIEDGGDDPVQLARRRAGGVEEQALVWDRVAAQQIESAYDSVERRAQFMA